MFLLVGELRRRSRLRAAVYALLAIAGLCLPVGAGAQEATLVGDAHVSSAQPTVNAGTLSNLNVGGAYTALVQFDLGVLPVGTTAAQITRATLKVYCNRADVPGAVSLESVGGAWTELGVTYATMPSLGSTVATAQVVGAGEFVTFDVTAAVQGWVTTPATNDGLALSTAGSGAVVQFDSKENDQTAHAPELEIALAAGGSGSGGGVGPTGATGATGAQGPQGLQGVSGLMGPAGPVGATGAMGATGAQGPTGPAGLSGGGGGIAYQGAYSAGASYALGDVVEWAGSSWVSLTGLNAGNTPGMGAGSWGLLASAGAAGASGVQGPMGMMGPQGSAGSQGAMGPAGQQGIPGATGAAGLQGPMGPQGAAGPVGMSFAGVYDSTANYGVGDGVMWQGAGWVSLVASNHGNTPSLSPGDWAMFAASGAAGATGVTGAMGPAGANGLDGAPGVAGQVGATGAAGVAGSPGLVYQGNYASGMNYGVGDVVVWQGASWVSLVVGNVGQTPGVGPGYWGVLTSVGPQGPMGVAGPAGSVGMQGTQGEPGAAGAQGAPGPMGIQGPAGAQGLTGAMGAVGSAGPQGLPGVAGSAGQQGIPGTPGATGLQGATGVAGPMGMQGPAGTNGTNGVNGTPGLVWQGAWSSATNYAMNDAVSYGGTSYLSLLATNMGQRPDLYPAAWSVLASAGAAGATGAVGATGAMGPTGPAGVAGAAGATGAAGAAGAPGINFRGVWTAQTYYAVNDGVTYGGSTYLAVAAGSGSEPDVSSQAWSLLAQAGAVGPTGAQGVAATVTVGTVTTLAAGATATVTNAGTAGAAVLNFGIPQGAAGANGGSGSGSGTASGNFAAMYHAVSFSTVYYAVNSPNASATETSGTVMAWVPLGCSATRLDVYSQQGNTVTVTLRAGSLGSMESTALACFAASNGSCTSTGSVAIAAGGFIDLEINGASGTAAGVWTALQCQ